MIEEQKPVDILVLTYNRIKYFETFVEELYKNTDYPFRLIVIDNGSTDGTRELILDLTHTGKIWQWVFTNNNLLMAEAFNEGFKLVESELFITVADDMIAPKIKPCWLTIFVAKMNSDNNIGSINCVARRRSYEKFKKN